MASPVAVAREQPAPRTSQFQLFLKCLDCYVSQRYVGDPGRRLRVRYEDLCVDFSRSCVADAAERGTFNSRLAARSSFSAEWTRISQTRAEWLFFGVDSDFALVLVAANRAAFQSSRRSLRESSDDAGISATVSMPLVATCSDGGGRLGAATKSDRHASLALARSRVDWAYLCSRSR
jgi:hypothetical protein